MPFITALGLARAPEATSLGTDCATGMRTSPSSGTHAQALVHDRHDAVASVTPIAPVALPSYRLVRPRLLQALCLVGAAVLVAAHGSAVWVELARRDAAGAVAVAAIAVPVTAGFGLVCWRLRSMAGVLFTVAVADLTIVAAAGRLLFAAVRWSS